MVIRNVKRTRVFWWSTTQYVVRSTLKVAVQSYHSKQSVYVVNALLPRINAFFNPYYLLSLYRVDSLNLNCTMKLTIASSTPLALASTHSWLHCTSHNNTNVLEWMKSNATAHASDHVIDPLMPWFADLCHGWPRAKQNPGDWVGETKNYAWDLQAAANSGDIHACHPTQRNATYYLESSVAGLNYHYNPALMATATPGSSVRLMFGGNGHSRGAPLAIASGNPGIVAVYWAGEPETEIADVNDLTANNLVQEDGFNDENDESFSFPTDMNVRTPSQGLVDKGNWQTLRLPECMKNGRHMMVWVWRIEGMDRFSTCFDTAIE
jgi:hypothetical protein